MSDAGESNGTSVKGLGRLAITVLISRCHTVRTNEAWVLPKALKQSVGIDHTSALKGPVRVPDGVNEIHSHAFDEIVRPALEVYPYSGAHAFCVKEYWPVILLEYCRFALPSALTEVKDEAFEGTRAQLVEFPASCAHIGSAAFRGGEVRVILLPEGIGDIADDAFQGCPLRTVVCNEDSKAWTWALAHGYTARTPFEEAW